MTTKRLYRSETDKKVAGVCGGIAEYANIDPTLVRIVFILLTLAGGPGVLLYFILMFLMPKDPLGYAKLKNDEL